MNMIPRLWSRMFGYQRPGESMVSCLITAFPVPEEGQSQSTDQAWMHMLAFQRRRDRSLWQSGWKPFYMVRSE